MTCTAFMTYLFFVFILLWCSHDVYCCEEGICKIARTYHGGESNPGIQNGGIFGVTIYANASTVLAHMK